MPGKIREYVEPRSLAEHYICIVAKDTSQIHLATDPWKISSSTNTLHHTSKHQSTLLCWLIVSVQYVMDCIQLMSASDEQV